MVDNFKFYAETLKNNSENLEQYYLTDREIILHMRKSHGLNHYYYYYYYYYYY